MADERFDRHMDRCVKCVRFLTVEEARSPGRLCQYCADDLGVPITIEPATPAVESRSPIEEATEMAKGSLSVLLRDRDPKEPPPHYKAKQPAKGVEAGAELMDVVAAFRSREEATAYLRVEMLTKAMRLNPEAGAYLADLHKIEQAAAKLRVMHEEAV